MATASDISFAKHILLPQSYFSSMKTAEKSSSKSSGEASNLLTTKSVDVNRLDLRPSLAEHALSGTAFSVAHLAAPDKDAGASIGWHFRKMLLKGLDRIITPDCTRIEFQGDHRITPHLKRICELYKAISTTQFQGRALPLYIDVTALIAHSNKDSQAEKLKKVEREALYQYGVNALFEEVAGKVFLKCFYKNYTLKVFHPKPLTSIYKFGSIAEFVVGGRRDSFKNYLLTRICPIIVRAGILAPIETLPSEVFLQFSRYLSCSQITNFVITCKAVRRQIAKNGKNIYHGHENRIANQLLRKALDGLGVFALPNQLEKISKESVSALSLLPRQSSPLRYIPLPLEILAQFPLLEELTIEYVELSESLLRGLPHTLKKLFLSCCRTAVTDEHMGLLCALEQLEELQFNNAFTSTRFTLTGLSALKKLNMNACSGIHVWGLVDGEIDGLNSLKLLEEFDISQTSITAATLRELSTSLIKLNLYKCIFIGDEDVSWLYRFEKLEELDLTGTSFTGSTLEALPLALKKLRLVDCKNLRAEHVRSLCRLVKLEELDLSLTDVTEASLRELPTSLKRLRLRDCDLLSNQNLGFLRALIHLEEIEFSGGVITEASLRQLPQTLKKLGLANCYLSNHERLLGTLVNLDELDFSWRGEITEDMLRKLPPTLKKLSLAASRNLSKEHVSLLRRFVKLEELDLECTDITVDALYRLPISLKRLNLRGCKNLTDQDVRTLRYFCEKFRWQLLIIR